MKIPYKVFQKMDKEVRRHHRLNGNEFEQTPGDSEGQGSLACCSPWGHKESDTTEQLNWTELTEHAYQVPDTIKKNNKKLEVRRIRKTTKWLCLDPVFLTLSKNKFKNNLSFPFILLLLLQLLFETLFQSIFFKLQDGGCYHRIIKFSIIGKLGNYLGQSLSL